MKILCISDQVDPLIYSLRIKSRFEESSFVISAGDLPHDYLDFISSMLNKPLLYIEGNHSAPKTQNRTQMTSAALDAAQAFGAINLGFRIRNEEGILILGLPGSKVYNRGPHQYSEVYMYFRVFLLLPRLLVNRLFYGRWIDLILTHAAPKGIHDLDDKCHRGFKCFLRFMRFLKPKWLVHGHIHLYDLDAVRISTYFNTKIINAFSHWVIDTLEND